MPKAIVVEDDQLEHAVKVAKVSSAENGVRDAALLLACFGTGMTVTELCLLRVSDYLQAGGVLRDSQVRAEIAYNHKPRPLCWTNKKLTNAIDAHLAERLERGHGVSSRKAAYRGLDPASPLFVSGRTGEGLKLSAKQRDGKTYYSATQLSRLFTRLFEQAGIEGASAQSGRRTLAVKLKRRGIDLRHISEILGIESLEAVKKLCAGDPARLACSEDSVMAVTGAQFDALVKLMRGSAESPGNRAARRVLVDGASQAEAMRETGASRSTVHLTVKRYTEAYELMRKVFVQES